MQTAPLQARSERLDGDRVKLHVEVPEAALSPALDAAYRSWANDIKVPGFRKGRVPRRIIDARVGPEVVREQALRDAMPDLYSEALKAEDLEAIAPPEIEVLEFEAGKPLVFEATVDVRPEVVVPDLTALHVEAPSMEVTDEDVDEQIERLRDRFAELDTVSREARRGDFALIDLNGTRHGEPVEGASAPDLLYEVGSRTGPPKLDDQVEGNRPGAILKFTDTMPPGAGELAGQELSFTVLLKEVKAKRLPPVDDDFAKTVGEFDSLDELREDLRKRLAGARRGFVLEEIGRLALSALVDASDLEPPAKLVDSEFDHRLHHLEEDLKRAGLTLERYAPQVDSTELELRSELRRDTTAAIKAELLLEQVAREQEVEVTQEDIAREIAMAAAAAGKDTEEVAKEVVQAGRLGAIAADIMRRKALEHIVQAADVIGRPPEESTVGSVNSSGGSAGASSEEDAGPLEATQT
jgi:trigger factor